MDCIKVGIDQLICDILVDKIEDEARGKWRSPKNLANNTGLSIYKVNPEHMAHRAIQMFFPDKIIHTVRIHRFDPDDWVSPHTDTAFPGCDTVIIRLDGGHESRLMINGTPVHETKGVGYYLPEHTIHEVTKGTEPRYTLVAWFIK